MRGSMSTNSDAISIHELLHDRSIYQMPLFQRRYQWTVDEQLEKFWSDITAVVDDQVDRSFLGAIVLQTEKESTSKRSRQFTVIDGQQRITTFYLFLCAVVNFARQNGYESAASDLESQYLSSSLSAENGQAKIVPTIRDNANLNEVLRGIPDNKVKLLPDVGKNDGQMILAYMYFGEKIEDYIEDFDEGDKKDRLEELYAALLDKMEIVQIVLDKSHNANEVFDRLNTAGRPLTIMDLVRNEMFQLVSSDYEVALRLYNELWGPFEQSFEKALSDKDAIERGKIIDGFFFPYALTRLKTAKKNNLLQDLRRIWARLEAEDGENCDHSFGPECVIRDLEKMRDPYLAIDQGIRISGIGDDLWEAIRNLRRIPLPGVAHPYFLSLLASVVDGVTSEDRAAKVCSVVESFFVRRGINGLEPTGLHAIFKKLWDDVGDRYEDLTGALETRTISFPSDDEVREAVRTKALYKRRVEKFVLAAYEAYLQEQSISRLSYLPKITTDHVMPQSYQGDWKSLLSEERHEELKDLWGNLVPLSSPENSAKGAKNFAQSKAALSDETSFKTTKKLLSQHDEWNEETILARCEELSEWAVARWPK